MSHLEYNVKAKFVYTKLLPLVREATRSAVESVNYEVLEDDETVVLHCTDGAQLSVNVTGDSLLELAGDVLEHLEEALHA